MYAINDGGFYRDKTKPLIESLRKKAKKGEYNVDKAVDAYYDVVCEASKMYEKDFGYSFSVADRFTAAVDMEKYYRDNEVFYDLSSKPSVLESLHKNQDKISERSNEDGGKSKQHIKETEAMR